jgi:CubicO group peptidase (beta-lactamase class C family)
MPRFIIYLLAILVFNSCLFAQSPDQSFRVVNPVTAGYPSTFFPRLGKKINDSIPSVGSFLVWSHGAIVYEGYFHGASEETSFDIKSITKSMISALAGIAKDRGMLPDINTPVLPFFPEFAKSHSSPSGVWFADEKGYQDSIRATLRLRDLLTMQTGMEWSDFGPVAKIFVNAADPVRFTFDVPFAETPGTRFNYCSAAASVFSAVLAKCVKTDLRSFAETNLFRPAGMTLTRWDIDPAGRYVGASEMYMTPRDLLRFGLIYLHHGKTGDKQLIPQEWVNASTAQQARLDYWDIMPRADGYGYFWWRRRTNGHQAYIASGFGGQLIAVIPDLEMVLVATCFLNGENRGREEIRRLHLFIDQVTKISK